MDFTYTPEQLELRERAAALAAEIMVHEEACEAANGLPAGGPRRRSPTACAITASNAINMPAEWGGQGLGVLDQVIVQEQLGRLTNALWDMVWRPANALRACDEAQRERYLLPGIRGERRDCVAVTERDAGSDPSAIATTAERVDGGFRDRRREVVRHRRRRGGLPDRARAWCCPSARRRCSWSTRTRRAWRSMRTPRYMHTFVYEHPEFGFTDVRVGEDAVLGGIGQGYELTRDWFVEERLMIGARAIGAAERALRMATDWAAERVQGGGPIVAHQLIQGMIADSRRRHRDEPRARAPDRLGGRPRPAAQAAAREGRGRQARRRRGGGPRRRPLGADPRRARLHAREPVRAALPRHPRRPHLGGHVGDPAADRRQRGRQARARRRARVRRRRRGPRAA